MSVCDYCLVPPCLFASCCLTQCFLPSEEALRVAPSTRWQLVGRVKLLSHQVGETCFSCTSSLLLFFLTMASCLLPSLDIRKGNSMLAVSGLSKRVAPGAAYPPASTSGPCPFRDDGCARGWLRCPAPASASQCVAAPPRAAGACRRVEAVPGEGAMAQAAQAAAVAAGRTVLRRAGGAPVLGRAAALPQPPRRRRARPSGAVRGLRAWRRAPPVPITPGPALFPLGVPLGGGTRTPPQGSARCSCAAGRGAGAPVPALTGTRAGPSPGASPAAAGTGARGAPAAAAARSRPGSGVQGVRVTLCARLRGGELGEGVLLGKGRPL